MTAPPQHSPVFIRITLQGDIKSGRDQECLAACRYTHCAPKSSQARVQGSQPHVGVGRDQRAPTHNLICSQAKDEECAKHSENYESNEDGCCKQAESCSSGYYGVSRYRPTNCEATWRPARYVASVLCCKDSKLFPYLFSCVLTRVM